MNNTIRNFIREYYLQPGDAVVAKKIRYRVLDHFIIYLGFDYNGHWFIANSMDEGVRQYDEDEVIELIKTFEPVKIRRFTGNDYGREQAVARALSQEGQPYSLFGNNCEHFANYVQKAANESPQVGIGVFTFIAAIIVGVTTLGRR